MNPKELLAQAVVFKKLEQYDKAIPILTQLAERTNYSETRINYEYADCLKKVGNYNRALEVAKRTYKLDPMFEVNTNVMTWCLYYIYYKELKEGDSLNKPVEIAEWLLKNTTFNKYSAHKQIVLKMLKTIPSTNTETVINLLDQVSTRDYCYFSAIPYTYTDKETNVPKETASEYERLISAYTRALFKAGHYEKCLQICSNSGLLPFNYHNDNDFWIDERKYVSVAKVGRLDEAIIGLEKVLTKKQFWRTYEYLGDIYAEKGEHPKAKTTYLKAVLTSDPDDMKVNLIYKLGELFEQTDPETTNKHYLYYKHLMDHNEWAIRGDKKTKIDGLPEKQTVNKKVLKSLWEELYMQNAIVYSGSVKKIMDNSGFIKYEDQTVEKQIYYSNRDVKGNVILNEGDVVVFCMESSFDRKKNKASSKATHICKK
mgnify:FL=1